MKNIEQLQEFENLEVGQSMVIEGHEIDEVRANLKTQFPGTGHRVIEIGSNQICIVKTQGRFSKKKQGVLEQISDMHPFQRVVINEERIDYVRQVINEYNKENGDNLQAKYIGEDPNQQIIVFRDPLEPTVPKWDQNDLMKSLQMELESRIQEVSTEE